MAHCDTKGILMTVADKKVVVIDYTLTNKDGQVLDKSENGQFAYLHGADNIIPGLENALAGKSTGDSFEVSVSPEEGYGQRDDNMVQTVSIDMFESADQVVVGQQFHAQSPEGHHIMITVTNVDGDQVTIDGNHPLAGQQLNFTGSVVEVRDATDQEIEHGHVHAHGHDH
jgi:FKBP-type peptidyl-prolyl cis-trans isomerase SlyD